MRRDRRHDIATMVAKSTRSTPRATAHAQGGSGRHHAGLLPLSPAQAGTGDERRGLFKRPRDRHGARVRHRGARERRRCRVRDGPDGRRPAADLAALELADALLLPPPGLRCMAGAQQRAGRVSTQALARTGWRRTCGRQPTVPVRSWRTTVALAAHRPRTSQRPPRKILPRCARRSRHSLADIVACTTRRSEPISHPAHSTHPPAQRSFARVRG